MTMSDKQRRGALILGIKIGSRLIQEGVTLIVDRSAGSIDRLVIL